MNYDFFNNLSWGATHWHWWILGMILLAIEVFAPGFFFLWFGISAGILGLIILFDPNIAWQIQIILYALLSLVSILVWRISLRSSLIPPTDQPLLNRRTAQYIGRIFTLEQPIINGRGRIRVDDSWWTVEGKDLPTATVVKVVAVENMILRVAPVAISNNPPF